MSKRSAKRRQKRVEHAVVRPKPPKPMSDQAVYFMLLVVGFFIVILAWLFTEGRHWSAVALGYLIALAYLTNLYTYKAYRGRPLANWQQSLARVPLRFVGYGTRGGKPLEAAHHHPETKTALLVSIALSAALVAGLSLVLIPTMTQ